MSDIRKPISGFSKLSKRRKIKWIVENFFKDPENVARELMSYWHSSNDHQELLDNISENTISNYHLPYGVVPNFIINGKDYVIPFVTEESSVVAAASSAAKFWFTRGGFKAEVVGMEKIGHVHFYWEGDFEKLKNHFEELELLLRSNTNDITANMRQRGGGIISIDLIDKTDVDDNYYQLEVKFDTKDSMGANFINSCLESFASSLQFFIASKDYFSDDEKDVDIIMSILSNYTPDCRVIVSVECPIEELGHFSGDIDANKFAKKFYKAIQIAHLDSYRATTHNKGIFNGVDAVVLATANDFRAVEACGHTYASRSGQYRSLSHCSINNGIFKFWIDLPLALGTVGGLTAYHPMAKRSFELLGYPNAEELMMIVGASGLAQNFAAIKSLVTTGIQKGHMKMHLKNILVSFEANDKESEIIIEYFKDKVPSYNEVRVQLGILRNNLSD